MGLATTRGALLTGVDEDDLGDEIDLEIVTPGWDDFALSIIERSRSVQDQASGTWRTVAYLVARVPQNLPAGKEDRIRDNRTGIVYVIDDETNTPRGISGFSSRTLEIRQTSA